MQPSVYRVIEGMTPIFQMVCSGIHLSNYWFDINSDGIEVTFKMLEAGYPVDEYCDNDVYELSLIHPELILRNSTLDILTHLQDSMSSKEYISLLPAT